MHFLIVSFGNRLVFKEVLFIPPVASTIGSVHSLASSKRHSCQPLFLVYPNIDGSMLVVLWLVHATPSSTIVVSKLETDSPTARHRAAALIHHS